MSRLTRLLLALPLFAGVTLLATAVPPVPEAEKGKKKALPEAEEAAARAQVAGGRKATVWAAEPLLANPVAFAFDEHGRCFVAETYRLGDGVPDTRGYMHWLDDDIGSRSVADRLKKYERHRFPDYTQFAEQLRVVWDSAGGGRADKSEVFAGGFNRPQDGIASGVLARKGTVYFTNIPDLYAFGSRPDSTKPTSQASLATGFGIRDQFVGHDLHGLILGPDGKLYFSVGDRGLNVTTNEGKHLFNPDSGAVLRCDPDGRNLEIVHVGLRNPQELAFDDFGNLFTYDNNSDSGDQARWVYVVEGGDSGWRCGYQYGTLMHHDGVPQGNRGPWNTEKIWHTQTPDQPAYVVPPLKHFGNGPSGLVHYPGVGLGDNYKGHFFACDFTANPGNSVIWSLAVKPKGAAFEVVDLEPFVRNMVPTDCDFGPDGAFYWLDWVGGWGKPGKGRVFRVADAEGLKHPAVAEAKTLLAEGVGKKSVGELAKLLEHPHQKVRLEAQHELAGRAMEPTAPGAQAVTGELLRLSAATGVGKLSRLHALWALAAVGRTNRIPAELAFGRLEDADPDVRVAAAKAVAAAGSQRNLIAGRLARETDARVAASLLRCLATYRPAAGQLPGFADPAFRVLASNADADPYLRQAAAQLLASVTDQPGRLVEAWKAAGPKYDAPAVRLGVVLALRRLKDNHLADFLAETDAKVVAEAARAIHDQDLMTPMAELARLTDKPGLPEAVAYRALSANFKLGGPEHAARVAGFAARSQEPDHLRVAALKLLADWTKPPRRDQITGLTQSLPERPAAVAKEAVKPVLEKVFAGPDKVRAQAVQTVAKLGVSEVGPLMAALVRDEARPAAVRAEALFALDALKAAELKDAAGFALEAKEPRLRAAARVVRAKADAATAARELPALLADEKASAVEKQMAFAVLGTLPASREADAALAGWLDRLLAGSVPADLKLDLLEAAQARSTGRGRGTAALRDKLKAYDQQVRAKAGDNLTLRYPEALSGGDPDKGREVFLANAAVYCQRCHKLDGQGGEVGPPVNGLGKEKTREYLLESIVHPNAQIAQGYQSVILNTLDGAAVTGVLRAKDAKNYTVVTADNKVLTVPVADVESSKPDKSAMPDDLHKKLSKRELRDLVEFLASLKEPGKK